MTKNIKLILLTIVISVAIVLGSWVIFCFYVPLNRFNSNPIELIVEEGDGLKIVAQKLSEANFIRSRLLFVTYIRVMGWDNELKAGKYILFESLNIPDIAYLIVSGKSESDDIVITIPEGLNIWEVDKLLTDQGLIREGEFGEEYYKNEGYLFPDTYRLNQRPTTNNQPIRWIRQAHHGEFIEPPAQGPEFIEGQLTTLNFKIIRELREKMRENFDKKTMEIFGGLSLEKQKEVILVASILEKEAKTEEDMKLVVGIIYKRIELDMPLQIDATVIYGTCLTNYKLQTTSYKLPKNCDVTFQSPAKEIKIDGPYNSYTRKGLPPGPISNPGLKAIKAAFNPIQSDYLYYLSTRDGSQIIYSKTPAEHAVNRKKYLGI